MVHVMSEVKRCAHGVIAPHECDTCLDELVVPSHWLEPVGGSVIDKWSKMQGMNGSGQYSEPLYSKADFDAQRLRADTAEAEVENLMADLDEIRDEKGDEICDAYNKLAAAEQRIAELSADNQQLRKLLEQTLAALNPSAKLSKSIRAALNPNPEAESHESAGLSISDLGLKCIDEEIKKNGMPK